MLGTFSRPYRRAKVQLKMKKGKNHKPRHREQHIALEWRKMQQNRQILLSCMQINMFLSHQTQKPRAAGSTPTTSTPAVSSPLVMTAKPRLRWCPQHRCCHWRGEPRMLAVQETAASSGSQPASVKVSSCKTNLKQVTLWVHVPPEGHLSSPALQTGRLCSPSPGPPPQNTSASVQPGHQSILHSHPAQELITVHRLHGTSAPLLMPPCPPQVTRTEWLRHCHSQSLNTHTRSLS